MYNASKDKNILKKSRQELKYVYSKLPETTGCDENINKENGCRCYVL